MKPSAEYGTGLLISP